MTTNNGFPGELPPDDQPSGPVAPPPGMELPSAPETQKPAGPFMEMPPEAPKAEAPPMELPPEAPKTEAPQMEMPPAAPAPEPTPAPAAPKVSPLQRYSDALGNPYARDEDDEFSGQSSKTQDHGYSGLAIASLVASLLCCGFIGLPLGIIALIVNRDGAKKGKGLAIAGSLIGLIGLLVIVIGGYTLFDKSLEVAEKSCSVENPTANEKQLCQTWKDFEAAKNPANPAIQ